MSQWRTGHHPTDEPGPRQKTIYGPDGELRGVMFTTEDAHLVVNALNARDEITPEFVQVAERAALITALAVVQRENKQLLDKSNRLERANARLTRENSRYLDTLTEVRNSEKLLREALAPFSYCERKLRMSEACGECDGCKARRVSGYL